MLTVQGEYHSKFPNKKFKKYLEANLRDAVDKCENYGCWYEDKFVEFFAKLCLKRGITNDHILDTENWPSVVKNLKNSEDFD